MKQRQIYAYSHCSLLMQLLPKLLLFSFRITVSDYPHCSQGDWQLFRCDWLHGVPENEKSGGIEDRALQCKQIYLFPELIFPLLLLIRRYLSRSGIAYGSTVHKDEEQMGLKKTRLFLTPVTSQSHFK